MNPTRNPITGDFMITGAASESYRDGWDRIFGDKKPELKQDAIKQVKNAAPRSAFFLTIIEFERGWGKRVDGYIAFPSKEAAQAYRDKEYASRKNDSHAPDFFVNYDDKGWFPISDSVAQKFDSGVGHIYFKYPGEATNV